MKNIVFTLLIYLCMQTITEAQLAPSDDLSKTNENGLESFSLYNIAISVANIDSSIKWYQEVFGFKLISRSVFSVPAGSAEAAVIEAGGVNLELIHVPDAMRIEAMFAEVPKHLIPIGNKFIVFQVNDLVLATKELEKKGVEFVWREQYLAGKSMFSTMVKDVDGNKINIFQTNTIIGNERLNEPFDAEKIVKQHLSIWSETNEVARAAAVSKIYADDIKLVDPFFTSGGIEKVNGFINQLQANHPGYVFSLMGEVMSHHSVIKFNWSFDSKTGPEKITGSDIMMLQNGRVKTLYVFINDL
jgi:catechol 2,3-dioxygenase-like lactoylglutathione lyase family enzyme